METENKITPQDDKPAIKVVPKGTTKRLLSLLKDHSIPAEAVMDYIEGQSCGLESQHTEYDDLTSFHIALDCGRFDVVKLLDPKHAINSSVIGQGRSALHLVSEKGNLEMVKYFVEECGLDVLLMDTDRYTAFDLAARNKHREVAEYLILRGVPQLALNSAACGELLDIMKYLLGMKCDLSADGSQNDLRADPTAVDTDLKTPLHWVCENGMIEVIRSLISKGVSIDAIDSEGDAPLHTAIDWGKNEIALLLLELGANPSVLNGSQETPLHVAARGGAEATIKTLIAKGAPINALDSDENTPLMAALKYVNTAAAMLLLDLGADPTICNERRLSPLYWAAENGMTEAVKALIGKGVSIDVTNDRDETPLYRSIYRGQYDITLLLLEFGANTSITNRGLVTPLHLAATSNAVTLIKPLVAKGAPINALDSDGCTPLMYASMYCTPENEGEVALLLLDLGADPTICNAEHISPLQWACRNGVAKVVKALISKGASINVTDDEGDTPLHTAIDSENSDVALLLLQLGANPSAINTNKETPLQKARQHDMQALVKILIEHVSP